jgi:hypothetical protein
MATYYVTTGGSAGNTGLSPSTPWTLAKAFLSAVAGDTVYIAPGVYRGAFTLSNSGTSGSPIQFIGDPLAAQGWTGISAGQVRVTNISDDLTGTAAGATLINGSIRSWISFSKISFECIRTSTIVAIQLAVGWSITQCQIVAISTNSVCQVFTGGNGTGGTDFNFTFTRNVVVTNGSALYTGLARHTSAYGVTANIKNCIFFGHNTSGESFGIRCFAFGTGSEGGGYTVQNCTFIGFTNAIGFDVGNTSFPHSVTNSSFIGSVTALTSTLGTTVVTENFNRILAQTARNGFPTGASTSVNGSVGVEYGYNEIVGLPSTQMVSSIFGSPNTGFGTATNALPTDLFSNTWTGATPDAGAATYATLSTLGFYAPTERNASTITIAPGSTSQSIELYLGATGLTASTSGLSARYSRTRTASVSIPLVARTIAQAWTAGGFAEVDSTNMPGVYRVDLPDAALAAGADDVTIVVRGASGTNGAVMTVKLSSGGLTEAQTASAVWGASPVGYNDATTYGGVVNQIDQTVTGIDSEVGDIPSMVWEELRANHTTAGSFGQYVNAELLTPITSAALVRMGPYEVKADGLGASYPLDIQKGAQHGVDIQCVDGNGNGIDITSATVTAKVYNSGATLVDTYACTATYAADGRATFVIDTTVTNTPGTYTATITRTTGASDTQVFGPLRIYVRDI